MRPFDPYDWCDDPVDFTVRNPLPALHAYMPNRSERVLQGYAAFSKNYWEGVNKRKYEYRLGKKLKLSGIDLSYNHHV
jgi:hypothetical protein